MNFLSRLSAPGATKDVPREPAPWHIKIYLGVQETSGEQARKELEELKKAVLELLEKSSTAS